MPEGSKVIPVLNDLRKAVQWETIFLTQDWHPADHISFASNNGSAPLFSVVDLPGIGKQVMWPNHCVQGTEGAEFHKDLLREDRDVVVRKGKNKQVDSYR